MKHFRIFFVVCVSISAFVTIANANSIGEIEMHFCNTNTGQDNKTLSLTGEAEKAIPLCLSFYNKSETPTSIKINFVDGTITNDGSKKKACLEEGTTKYFGQYVTGIQTQIPYSIDGKSFLDLTGHIIFPAGYVGEVIGCLTYATTDQSTKEGSINILVRKANIMMVSLSGEIKRSIDFTSPSDPGYPNMITSSDPKVTIYYDPENKQYILGFRVSNSGNITESPIIHGQIHNTRGRTQDIDITTKEIPAHTESDYSATIALPRYASDYSLTISGQSMPIFLLPDSAYDMNNTGAMTLILMATFQTTRDIHSQSFIIVISSIGCGIIGCILLIVIIIYRKKRKKIISPKSKSKRAHQANTKILDQAIVKATTSKPQKEKKSSRTGDKKSA